MTCKDCIHCEVCEDRERVEKLNQNCNPPPYIRNGNFSPIGCLVFKNKADFVEVVRCKDCGMKGVAFCMAGDFPLTKENENNFCSYGERKDT